MTCRATNARKSRCSKNTRAFLDGKDANNILLYGDKGHRQSLDRQGGRQRVCRPRPQDHPDSRRAISPASPNQPEQTPARRSAFIVFLDDLTFDREDDNFAALKAFIEGGLAGKPSNLVIYATSNRRHLIRESMADRQGDDVRVRDTLSKPSPPVRPLRSRDHLLRSGQDEYRIVEQLADESGLALERDSCTCSP